MRFKYMVITMLIMGLTLSCSSTGVMGLATEDAVMDMDQRHTREIQQLQADIKKINELTDRLEAVLEEAKQAKSNAKEALIIAQDTAAESIKIVQKIESVKGLLKEIEEKIENMPTQSIEKLIQILKKYVSENEPE